ncbi:hypothetical protein PRZ48_014038 [Zasmidium cellare]|uniref:NADH:flavin oxidoreductase/NADH oxidase N-terminal domain-containing protein n=1 Tax=Zasmidium cellare TaxID=395010 RepID=A0ABR0DZS6_ZASCE|nr:hypothetical protein PRZ48_014038 [Zasmidium cellare]
MANPIYNAPVEGLPFFSPQHAQSPGSAVGLNANTPTLFKPLTIRSKTLRNRIVVAPMCQYSAADSGPLEGALTPYHTVTLGHYALKGAALVFIEATGVQPNGRISANCPGLWSDAQIDGVKAVADFIHGQGGLCGLQLAHAGRKASCVAPFISMKQGLRNVRATKDVGGWPENVVGPSGGDSEVWDGKSVNDPKGGYWAPRELSVSNIQELVQAWGTAAARAVRAGVDVLEIHGAHGYLINQFLSPVTNKRTDKYGGSYENRTRFLVEVIKSVRANIPDTMPLFLRLSTTEWLENTEVGKKLGCWTIDDTIRLAKTLPDLGIDLLDCSSGGNHPDQQLTAFGTDTKDYQTKLAAQIRKAVRDEGNNLLIGAVGLITEAEQARDIVEEPTIKEEADAVKKMTEPGNGKEPMADIVLVARQFMREPEWVLRVAAQLDLDVAWPSQFLRVRIPKL